MTSNKKGKRPKIQCSKCRYVYAFDPKLQSSVCPNCGTTHVFIRPTTIQFKVYDKKDLKSGRLKLP